MEFTKLLWEYRKQIDEIDLELLKLFTKRIEVVKEVWKLKKENNIPLLDKKRWNEVLQKMIIRWGKLWLSKKLIEDIWNRIHEESLMIEK
jgi:chorismate mutase